MRTRPGANEWKRLTRHFYTRPTLTVARDLLGRYLVRHDRDDVIVGRIVEVEAYRGRDDAASHAFSGRTRRNDVMFWVGGHLYVYFTYGMHFCANIVTGPKDEPGAVLLRAVEPVKGIGVMRLNRPKIRNDRTLTNGPAKLCEAFSLSGSENGTSLMGTVVYLTHGIPTPQSMRARSSRVGIKNGREKQWRFFERGNPWVSGNEGTSHRL